MKKIYSILVLAVLFLVSCGGDKGNDSPVPTPKPDPDPVAAPKATTLIFPDDNAACNEGSVINKDQSNVKFEWNASENTDSYEVHLINLNTNSNQTENSTSTTKTIAIDRGTPYQWFIVSKANGTNETATSPKWKFYNQGEGIENYAPFPAEAENPARGSSLSATTKVTLEWNGSDVDKDIISYEVFFGTEKTPTNSLGTTTDSTMEATVASGKTYYWKVETKDSQGNTSESEIFEFRIE